MNSVQTERDYQTIKPQRWANWHCKQAFVEVEAGGERYILSDTVMEIQR